MAKTFRPWQVEQQWLLPPSVLDFVPAEHPAHFIRDLVRESLDLSAIVDAYDEERGSPPYHPVMMTALLLYGYTQGVYASRRLQRACRERVDFMAVTGVQQPDFRTISEFRRRHLGALAGLFVQVLRLCQAAGLVRLGHVALDGTKVKANASKHAAMSYGRMQRAEAELAAEVEGWLQRAEAADVRDEAAEAEGRTVPALPGWVAEKQARLAKIREAKAALEAEARAQQAALPVRETTARGRRRGRPPQTPPGTPPEKAQRNFTDPESRILKTADGFVQGYNAQAAVDAASQVIVAQFVTQAANDKQQLMPLVAQIETNTGRPAQEVSADSGYCSEENLEALERVAVRGYVATGRQRHGTAAATGTSPTSGGPCTRAMRRRLRRGGYHSRYRLRKMTVEPVFGQIKQARGFRQFLLRGVAKVRGEWSLLCTVHNLLKLAARCCHPAPA